MATKVLQLDSSVSGDAGASAELGRHLIAQLQKSLGNLELVRRDLAADPLPHLTGALLQAIALAPSERSAEQRAAAALADKLIEELLTADILVVAAPMYNFGVPSTLKAWMDQVARAGTTFRYTTTGPEGLVQGKTVYILAARGGVHSNSISDSVVPHLQTFFSFLGVQDIRVVYAEGLNMSQRTQSLAEAKLLIHHFVQNEEAA